MIALAVQFKGRADTAKDAEKVRIQQQKTRDESEAAFRNAFAEIKRDFDEERRKNDRLDKRVSELVEAHSKDASEIVDLNRRLSERDTELLTVNKRLTERDKEISNLQKHQAETDAAFEALRTSNRQLVEALEARTQERDKALAMVIKQNGEIQLRDEQISKLTQDQKDMLTAQMLMQDQLKVLQKIETGKLDPKKVPEQDPSKAAPKDLGEKKSE